MQLNRAYLVDIFQLRSCAQYGRQGVLYNITITENCDKSYDHSGLNYVIIQYKGGQRAGLEPRRGHGCRNRVLIKTLGNAHSLKRRTGKSYSHVHVVTTGYMAYSVRYIANGRGWKASFRPLKRDRFG